jgi:hypothetical protein
MPSNENSSITKTYAFILFIIYYLSLCYFQVYLVTGTGISDTRSSHYTQFSGILLRPSQDTFRQAIRQAAQVKKKKVESYMLERRAKMKASLALSSLAEHTRNAFHRWLSMRGNV